MFASTVAALLGGCGAKTGDELLASELVYKVKGTAWYRSVEIDPWLASHPTVVRRIREWRVSHMLAGDDECYSRDGTGCFETATFELDFEGTRLLSVYENSQVQTGGAHPRGLLRDHLIDLATGEEIRFGDLFVSWAQVRPLIQREFCKASTAMREDLSTCPDIQKQAITLFSYSAEEKKPKATVLMVYTQDYELGYYAAGNGPVSIEIPPHLLNYIKPEYRSEFEDPA